MEEPLLLNFRVFTLKLVSVRKFRNFTVAPFQENMSSRILTRFSPSFDCLANAFTDTFFAISNLRNYM